MLEVVLIILFLTDSRSWMTPPKILTDIVSRKRITGECKENTNPDLHCLPEKKVKAPQTPDQIPQVVLKETNGNELAIIKAVNLIFPDVFYSPKSAVYKFEEMNMLGKSINDLFPEH